jgi:hypothetical protein
VNYAYGVAYFEYDNLSLNLGFGYFGLVFTYVLSYIKLFFLWCTLTRPFLSILKDIPTPAVSLEPYDLVAHINEGQL